MDEVQFVDQTLRDAHQSLWGMRMRPREALPVASKIDNVGFDVVDLSGWSHHLVRVRDFQEDPWESLDLLKAAMPGSRLRAGSATSSIAVFSFTPPVLLDLSITTHVRHGIGSYWILDCMYNLDQMQRMCQVTHDAGAQAVPAIMFSESPVHTDEYFADRARAMASWDCVDAVYVEDASGILTPDRAKTLIPKLVEAVGDKPLELHCHNNNGLAPLVYMQALEQGVRIFHTATKSLANGASLPATETMADNIARSGYTVGLDTDLLEPISDHFAWVAECEGYPTGAPADFHLFNFQHQLPGGMTGTLRNQLRKHGMEDRLPALLDEVIVVRRELGYPIMASPFSQFVGIQSLLNVTLGKRYAVVPDEVVLYTLGHYGEIPGEMDPNVRDQILSSPRGQELLNWTRPDPTLGELRAFHGKSLSDERLLLAALVDQAELAKMDAAGPVRTDYPTRGHDRMGLISTLAGSSDWHTLKMSGSGLSLTLSRRSTRSGAQSKAAK